MKRFHTKLAKKRRVISVRFHFPVMNIMERAIISSMKIHQLFFEKFLSSLINEFMFIFYYILISLQFFTGIIFSCKFVRCLFQGFSSRYVCILFSHNS